MEILSYGIIKPIEIECSECEARLMYVGKDVFVEDHKSYVQCPICGAKTQVAVVEQKMYKSIP